MRWPLLDFCVDTLHLAHFLPVGDATAVISASHDRLIDTLTVSCPFKQDRSLFVCFVCLFIYFFFVRAWKLFNICWWCLGKKNREFFRVGWMGSLAAISPIASRGLAGQMRSREEMRPPPILFSFCTWGPVLVLFLLFSFVLLAHDGWFSTCRQTVSYN